MGSFTKVNRYLTPDKWRFIQLRKRRSGEEPKNEMRVARISGSEEFWGDLKEKHHFSEQKNIQGKM